METLWPGMGGGEDARLIESYDTCWIFGDLNYRMGGVFTRDELLESIKAKGMRKWFLN
jgi:hypothetical protein